MPCPSKPADPPGSHRLPATGRRAAGLARAAPSSTTTGDDTLISGHAAHGRLGTPFDPVVLPLLP